MEIETKAAVLAELTAGCEKLEAKLKALDKDAEGPEVDEAAGKIIGQAAKAIEHFQGIADGLEHPYAAALEKIRTLWKPGIARLKTLKSAGKAFLESRLLAAAQRKRDAEEKAKAELEAARKVADATGNTPEALSKLRHAREEQERATAAAAESGTKRTAAGTFSGKEAWTFEIIDEKVVPEAFTKRVVDDVKVAAAIDAGTREIAGLRIYPRIVSRFRGRR